MGLKYLNGASWSEITREERYFCAHLFHLVGERGLPHLIGYLNERHGARLDPNANWELAYEACFYRDVHHSRRAAGTPFSVKRTFDLALLSDDDIMIIEAKANGEFHDEQLQSFALDRAQMIKETGVRRVTLAALNSSRYAVPGEVMALFDGPRLTWRELAELFGGDTSLLRADAIYEPSSARTYGRNNSDGQMTGNDLLACHRRGEDFWVGRGGGLPGPTLAADVSSGAWRTQKYETNRDAAVAPSRNWFRLGEFIRKVGVER
jgi:hypothetical protein